MSERFGKWTRIQRLGKYSECACDCGTSRMVLSSDLKRGASKSCGCTRHVAVAKAKAANTTHGQTNSPEYGVWVDMRRRCYQKHRPDYHRYGGRGITVCESWRSDFLAFYRDMGPRPAKCTLDRRDNRGPYSPENCHWASKKIQDRNKRTTVLHIFFGEPLTLVDAAERHGILVSTLRSRIVQRGWNPDRAVSEPVHLGRH